MSLWLPMDKHHRIARVRIDDDSLVEEALRLGKHRNKTAMVTEVLREYIRFTPQRREMQRLTRVECDPNNDNKKQAKTERRKRTGKGPPRTPKRQP